MTSRGTCKSVWLCATQDRTELCYRHYHTCWMTAGHEGDCDSANGIAHTSADRVGDMLTSIPEAYRRMEALGWKAK